MSALKISIDQQLDRIRLMVDVSVDGLVAIEGRSGSGKTSLLRAVAGLSNSVRGQIDVGRARWLTDSRSVKPEARSIGYLAQDAGLYPNLTALENVAFVLAGKAAKRRDHARSALAAFGLEDLVSATPNELSGGQRRRIALVRAVAAEREVYLLDEPFSSLDRDTANLTADALANVLQDRGRPCLITCHDASGLRDLCTQAITLSHGSVTAIRDLRSEVRLSDRQVRPRLTQPREARSATAPQGLLSTPSGFREGSR